MGAGGRRKARVPPYKAGYHQFPPCETGYHQVPPRRALERGALAAPPTGRGYVREGEFVREGGSRGKGSEWAGSGLEYHLWQAKEKTLIITRGSV